MWPTPRKNAGISSCPARSCYTVATASFATLHSLHSNARADWTAWQPGICQVGLWSAGQVGRHIKCWSRTIDLGLPPNIRRAQRDRREWSEGQSHKEEKREGGSGTGEGPGTLSWGGMTLFCCPGVPEFLVTPLLMGPVCLLNQGPFEEPFRSCSVWTRCMFSHGGTRVFDVEVYVLSERWPNVLRSSLQPLSFIRQMLISSPLNSYFVVLGVIGLMGRPLL